MFFFKIKNHKFLLILLIYLLLLSNCQLKPPKDVHGINFIKKRYEMIKLNENNKNDVIKILGRPHIIDKDKTEKWFYLERILTRDRVYKINKKKLLENNVVEFSFNKYGVIYSKKFYNEDNMNEIKFSQEVTENNISERSFIANFLQSVKQKMYKGIGN